MTNHIKQLIDEPYWLENCSEFSDKVINQVSGPVRGKVMSEIEDKVWDQVGDQVWVQIYDRFNDYTH